MVNVKPAYADVDRICTEAWRAYVEEGTTSMETLFSDAAAVLSVNYCIGLEEAGLLGILDQRAALQILKTAVDVEGIRSHERDLGMDGIKFRRPNEEGL